MLGINFLRDHCKFYIINDTIGNLLCYHRNQNDIYIRYYLIKFQVQNTKNILFRLVQNNFRMIYGKVSKDLKHPNSNQFNIYNILGKLFCQNQLYKKYTNYLMGQSIHYIMNCIRSNIKVNQHHTRLYNHIFWSKSLDFKNLNKIIIYLWIKLSHKLWITC